MKETNKVFVYGTLMLGHGNNHFLKNQIFLGDAKLEGYRLFDLNGTTFPAIMKSPGYNVIGELWQVDKQTSERIDMLEGVDYGMYTKQEEPVETPVPSEDGEPLFIALIKANVYVVTRENKGLFRSLNYSTEYNNERWRGYNYR